MIIIKVFLWALLALILIVILALFIPVEIEVRYTDDVSVIIQYLFLKFTVVGEKKEKPNKKKNSRKKRLFGKTVKTKRTSLQKKTVAKDKKTVADKPKVNSKKRAEPKKENIILKWVKNTFKEKGLSGLLNAFREIAKLAETLLKPIFKHIRIKLLDLNVRVAFEDAADTAVKYGYFCSGIYPALAVLLNIMKYDDYSVNIAPDFDKKEPEFDVFTNLKILPWFVVIGAVKALIDFLILRSKGKL